MSELANSSNSPHAEPESYAKHGLLNAEELRKWCHEHADTDFLVPGFLPRQPITLACGRSGEGKSPWNLQLAICLDLQLPFLGFPVGKRSRSIICTGEDYPVQTTAQIDRLTRALTGNIVTPPGVMIFSGNVTPEQFNLDGLEKRITAFKPDLVFLDPAITFFPSLEDNAEAVNETYTKLRLLQKQHGCAFILVHHLVKGLRDKEEYRPLSECYPNPRHWFDHARGTGALVQYADVRIGFDTSKSGTLHVGGYKRGVDVV
jgi:RecA-family ATPase